MAQQQRRQRIDLEGPADLARRLLREQAERVQARGVDQDVDALLARGVDERCAAGVAGQIVSVGGEEPGGTIAEVLAYRVADKRWVQLDDLRTPRHGLGVAALAGRVFVIGGGPEPGLTVSSANEALRLAP